MLYLKPNEIKILRKFIWKADKAYENNLVYWPNSNSIQRLTWLTEGWLTDLTEGWLLTFQ